MQEDARELNRSLLQPRKLATKELVAPEAKLRPLVRMQIGRIRRWENPVRDKRWSARIAHTRFVV